jgi:hypothetical protein
MEREIAALDERADMLADDARALTDELLQNRSAAVREALIEKEAELQQAREAVRGLKARRDAMAKPYVLERLTALRDSLRRKKLNVPEVNKVLKETVTKIVADPETGRLTIHWRHSDETTGGIPFASRHSKAFD